MQDFVERPPTSIEMKIPIVLMLLKRRRSRAGDRSEISFSRAEIFDLLKVAKDPWTSALLAELIFVRRRVEKHAKQAPYGRLAIGLFHRPLTRDSSARLLRRAVSRPLNSTLLHVQELIVNLQADKVPLPDGAREQFDAQLLALHQSLTMFSDRLLTAYLTGLPPSGHKAPGTPTVQEELVE